MGLKILGLAGSLRNRAPNGISEIIKKLKSHSELLDFIEVAGRDKAISNSEGYLACALYGAKKLAEIEFDSLAGYFTRDGSKKNIAALLKKVDEADAIIISTPVYFGDRSSLVQDFFDILRHSDINFHDKVLGVCSVGAKRNGGQETTIIYTLVDAMERGFIVTGNGPSTAQYGGTGVAGDIGTLREDFYGIETSMSTGLKVAQTAKIIKEGKQVLRKNKSAVKPKIGFWILADKDDICKKNIKGLLEKTNTSGVDIDTLDLTKYKFYKCNACHMCPGNAQENNDFKCIFNDDDMIHLHEKILSYDAILVASFCPKNTEGIETTYQKFLERTRYLRRDNFRLTNRLIAGFGIEEVGANNIFSMRAFTSLIRQNTVYHQPINQTYYKGNILEDKNEILDRFNSFIQKAKEFAGGVPKVDIGKVECPSVGYGFFKDYAKKKLGE